jgi:hypothetical protein
MTDATSGAGKSNPSGGPEITPISSEGVIFGLTRSRIAPTIHRARGEPANHCIPDTVEKRLKIPKM